MVLRNREINPSDENSDQKMFSGVTTRKSAALKALENANLANRNAMNELKCITTRLKLIAVIEEPESEPMDISIKKIETEESRKSLLKTIIEIRNAIRSHFSEYTENGLPIWLLSRFDNNDEFMNIDYLTKMNDHLIENELESKTLVAERGCRQPPASKVILSYEHYFEFKIYVFFL